MRADPLVIGCRSRASSGRLGRAAPLRSPSGSRPLSAVRYLAPRSRFQRLPRSPPPPHGSAFGLAPSLTDWGPFCVRAAALRVSAAYALSLTADADLRPLRFAPAPLPLRFRFAAVPLPLRGAPLHFYCICLHI